MSVSAPTLTAERCLHHPLREAVARCVECRQVFCRECITEHDDRIVCSACLKKLIAQSDSTRWTLGKLFAPMPVAIGLIIAWLFFYLAGRVFISIPARYHEGTVWLNPAEMTEE